ncbi:sulfatase family protein [Marinigracilibium pacificum]|uniref:Sulfatase n=1 Tax=Marinigracilibium pacificum TaxID=2729599 RepID=A0A848IV41_9BACT|nr:sulfatase [Marinigracilibium pacificum]NMM48363.1 sulfatase [Marinigracilibium pacificum]
MFQSKILYFLFLLVILVSCNTKDQDKTENIAPSVDNRPNILFVLADDWSFPHASAYGDKVINTPHFDKIAQNGILFTNAYTPSPSCTPARAAILTGRYPHALEQGGNLWGTLPKKYPNYVDLLEESGYVVGFQDKGWAPGNYEDGGYTRNPAGNEISNFNDFFENLDENKPFCFWYGTRDPHRPYTQGIGQASGLNIDNVEMPDYWPADSVINSDILDYYYEIERIDSDLDRLMFRLERTGLLENTIIIVTSDNGMPFPRAKANCYDLGTKVPLAITWAKMANKSIKHEGFINLIDLAPTLLEIAGLDVPEEMQGKSFASLIIGEASDYNHQKEVFMERERHAHARFENSSYPIRAIRDSTFLFIHNLKPDRWPAGNPLPKSKKSFIDIDDGPSKSHMISMRDKSIEFARYFELSTGKRPEFELYNILDDPDQTINLAGMTEYKNIVNEYKSKINKWQEETGDPAIKNLSPYPFDEYKYYGRLLDELTIESR